MGFVALKCPSCGYTVEVDESREFGFCSYCGTKIVQDKIVVEHRGSISISGVATAQSLLDRGFLFLEDKDYKSADQYFEKALDADPKCSKAYIGKLLCQIRFSNVAALNNSNYPLEKYDYFIKAKRFATPDELKEYEALEASVQSRLTETDNSFQMKIAKAESKENEIKTELESKKSDYQKNKGKKTAWVLLIVILCMVAFFSVIFEIGVGSGDNPAVDLAIIFLIIITIPSIIGVFFISKKFVLAKKFIEAYEETQRKLRKATAEKQEVINAYQYWKSHTFNV